MFRLREKPSPKHSGITAGPADAEQWGRRERVGTAIPDGRRDGRQSDAVAADGATANAANATAAVAATAPAAAADATATAANAGRPSLISS